MLGKPSHRTRQRLEQNGRQASATVLEIASRGMTITSGNEQIVANTKVMLKTKLRVEPDAEPAFEVEQRFRYSQFAIPTVGSRLAVIYDPDDNDKIMLSEDPVATTEAMLGNTGLGSDQMDLIKQLTAASGSGASRESMRHLAREWGEVHGATIIDGASLVGATPVETPVDQLEKLAGLRDRGILTEAEFQAQKVKILNGG
jgi:hypothetical protein